MDKNRIEGAAKQMKGIVREAVGRATGSRTTQMRGTAEKYGGQGAVEIRRRRGRRASRQKINLESEVAQARMIIGPAAEQPAIFALGFLDWQIVDRCVTMRHQTGFVELPVFVAVTAKPVARIVMPFVDRSAPRSGHR